MNKLRKAGEQKDSTRNVHKKKYEEVRQIH